MTQKISAVLLTIAAAILAAVTYLVCFDLARVGIGSLFGWLIGITPVADSVARWVNANLDPAFWLTLTLALGMLPSAYRLFVRRIWRAIEHKIVG
jgi:hypothetical protein